MFSPTPQWLPNDGKDRSQLPEGSAEGQGFHMDKKSSQLDYRYDNPGFTSDDVTSNGLNKSVHHDGVTNGQISHVNQQNGKHNFAYDNPNFVVENL